MSPNERDGAARAALENVWTSPSSSEDQNKALETDERGISANSKLGHRKAKSRGTKGRNRETTKPRFRETGQRIN